MKVMRNEIVAAFMLVAAVIVLIATTCVSGLDSYHSRYVYTGPGGRLIYVQDAQGHRIPDYSYAGYRGGGVRLPHASVEITLAPAAGDDTQRIQQALDEVSQRPIDGQGLRGAVLLKAGIYDVSGTLRIRSSGVVLRGQGCGPQGTVLHATTQEQSNWAGQWSNGLIVIAGKDDFYEQPSTRQAIRDEKVSLDQTTLTLTCAQGFKPGDPVMVQRNTNRAWVHALGMDQIPPRKDGKPVRSWRSGAREAYERTVIAVNGQQITIDCPLYDVVEQRYGGGAVYKYGFEGRIQNVGIENLRAVSVWEPKNGADPLTHSAAMVQFFNVRDGWAQDLVGLHFYGVGILAGSRTRNVSIEDCVLENANPDYYRSYRYVARYGITLNSQGGLVRRCRVFNCRHAFSVGSRVPGPNVFLDCDGPSTLGASEPHHRWSTGVLFDRCGHRDPTPILIMNRGNMGSGQGWTAGNSVMWNCIGDPLTVESPPLSRNYGIGCKGQRKPGPFEAFQPEAYDSWGHHVVPASLYLAQLEERLGREAIVNIDQDNR